MRHFKYLMIGLFILLLSAIVGVAFLASIIMITKVVAFIIAKVLLWVAIIIAVVLAYIMGSCILKASGAKYGVSNKKGESK